MGRGPGDRRERDRAAALGKGQADQSGREADGLSEVADTQEQRDYLGA